MKEHLSTISKNEPWTLDVEVFRQFAKAKPEITETGFAIPVDEKLGNLLQSYTLEAAYVDIENEAIINYGRDETVRLDGEGNMDCEFDGTWICYDGVPLATEVVASTASSVEYRSKILYNGEESYLSFSWDRDTETFAVNGVRGVSSTSIINLDPFNYMVNSRMTEEVKKGDTIVPIYEVSLEGSNKDEEPGDDLSHGKEIEVSKKSGIALGKLPAGYYLTAAVIGDQRGDVYYSQVVGTQVAGGKVKERSVNADFVGKDY